MRDVEKLKMGAGEGFDFGSLIDESQVAVTERHVNDAVAAGAKALTGGKRGAGAGSFYEPTVLVDVDHSMTCMTEETFGPTLPIMKVSSVDEAIRLANDSPYGLSGAVFSKDIERAKAVAVQLDCGAVNINDVISNLMCTTAPMGGWKTSGLGARFGGADGLRKYCRQEAVVAPRTNVGAGGNYYNNSPKALKRMNKLMTRMALSSVRAAPRSSPPAVHRLVTCAYARVDTFCPWSCLMEPVSTPYETMTTTTRCWFSSPRVPTSTLGAKTIRTTSG